MGHWAELRKLARQQHKILTTDMSGSYSATALIRAAERKTEIKPIPCPTGDSLLAGAEAVLDPEAKIIWFNKDTDPAMVAFYQMHEYAHFWLHDGQQRCSKTDIDAEASEDESPFGVARVEGYGPKERAEREANVFAREVLLPSDILYRWYVDEKMSAKNIAIRVGLPEGMVYHQLSYALLVSDLSIVSEEAKTSNPQSALDESQKEAAEWQGSPLLVEAGPGTGKTRTLVGRIQFLLNKKQSPAFILALTFSNKAAEEMRSRVAIVAPVEAQQIWMGTFHSFGLELLRKYGTNIGLLPDPAILDPVDALFLLERNLISLQLDRYQNLYEPTMYLRNILGAISRAKDELVGPAEYMSLAEQMRASATKTDQKEAAQKAIEVARVYAFYQAYLDRESLLDFGDLIFKTVTLLREHPDVRDELRRTYVHILVDEYQDVNRASGLLLSEIASENEGLWVVGDTRQAIYRFRGASPANMRLFTKEFTGSETRSLKHNYRSRPEIVKVFSALAPNMQATKGQPFSPWESKQSPTPGTVHMKIAEDLDAEAHGIADEIALRCKAGIPYRNQAILCRSHTTLGRIAESLEQIEVPILYLGDLFERPEIRDLLSLLSLSCQGLGSGLLRVSQFPEYQIPLADVASLLRLAREREVYFPKALELSPDIAGISEKGKRGLVLLANHLEGISYGTNAWSLMVQYLFERSVYLKYVLGDNTVSGQQRRLAIYQFLQFAHDQRSRLFDKSEDPKRSYLNFIRRLEIHGEEKQLRQVPDWAAEINAVRLLTVHSSKGLEFDVVYLPGLGQGYFPARRQGNACPAPVGMLAETAEDSGHNEEEECLFFVALSRARNVLCLSRANKYGAQNSKPSNFLLSIQAHLPDQPDGKVTWSARQRGAACLPLPPLSPATQVFDVRELDTYMTCPRKYYYEFVIGISGKHENSAYVQFHKSVYEVIRWIGSERTAGRPVDESLAHLRLQEVWQTAGPWDHPYEAIYRRDAELMISRAVQRAPSAGVFIEPPTWVVKLSNGRVQVRPDCVEQTSGGAHPVILRIRTGRPSESESKKDIYALYQVAGDKAYRGQCTIQTLYLSTGEVQPVQLSAKTIKTRLDHYDNAIDGIIQQHFSPNASDRDCPRCPHYFICPLPSTI